jgi:hypothetical protein
VLKFDAENPRAADDVQFEHFVSAKDWFAFNTVYGTSASAVVFYTLVNPHNPLQPIPG